MKQDPAKELDDELRFHLEQRTRDYIARGMSPEAARQAAAQRFGDAARVRDACAPLLAATAHPKRGARSGGSPGSTSSSGCGCSSDIPGCRSSR
jgi:hypothetical protein